MRVFENYGDRDFLQYGILVSPESSVSTADSAASQYRIVECRPYDEEDPDGVLRYQFFEADVDINDSWIDVEKVEQFSSTSKEKDPVHFAIACIDYYGPENFGVAEKTFQYDWKSCTKDDVVEQLRDYIFDWTDMKFDGVPFDLTKLVGTEYVDWLPTCVRDMIKSKLNEYYSGMEDADRSELIDELMDGTFNKMDEITSSLPYDKFNWRAITDNLTVCGMRIADPGPSL